MEIRCLNCMKVFEIPSGHENEDSCCPFCGFIENTPPKIATHLHPGVLVHDRYLIGTVIGSGGFGITYKSWDQTLDTVVAIKEFFPHGVAFRNKNNTISVYSSSDQDTFEHGKERFLREARSLAKFKNVPNTVTIYDFFETNGTAYLVMEYLEGCNMKEYQNQKGGALDFDMIAKMADEICDALSEVHAFGVIHRDISPDNIFVCSDGTFKLIDFGAIKQSYDQSLSATVILKHGYAPIEQYTKGGSVGPWTDIYALAATIYKLLTNVTPPEAVERVMTDELKPLYEVNPSVPREFSDAVMRALAIKSDNRYKVVDDFKAALKGGESEDKTILINSEIEKNSYQDKKNNFEIYNKPVAVQEESLIKKYWGVLLGAVMVIAIISIIVFSMPKDNASKAGLSNTEESSSNTEKESQISDDGKNEMITTSTAISADGSVQQVDSAQESIWKMSEIVVNTTETDELTNLTEFQYGVERLYFHSKVIEGPDDSPMELKMRIIFPDGSSTEATEQIWKGVGFYRAIGSRNQDGENNAIAKGNIRVDFIDNSTGALLQTTTITIN